MNHSLDSQALLAETESEEDQQGWLATFADLMSLLMCFFVLLLSFSEMDVVKFKQIAGSMKTAFGVQRLVEAEKVPLGTSVIAQEFSPGKPEQTLLNQVQQKSSQTEQAKLNKTEENDLAGIAENELDGGTAHRNDLRLKIEETFSEAILAGKFELDSQGQQLIIRFEEKGMFASGSGYLQPQFKPLLRSLSAFLADVPGQLIVSGHTDNIRLQNELYEDNLALSSARALAVARELRRNPNIRFVQVTAFADAKPLLPNTSPENRAKNRRVELSILQGQAKEAHIINQKGENSHG